MSDITKSEVLGALRKPARKGLQKIKAESLKPPELIIDESGNEQHKFVAVYVTGGKEHRDPCTQAVWKKILGPKSQPGRKPPGLDNKIYCEFFIIKEKDTVVGVDIVPENRFAKGAVPEDLKGKTEIRMRINTVTGELEVTDIPPKLNSPRLRAILDAIDALEVIAPGDEVAGCEVTQVAGNLVVLEPNFGE